VSAHWKCVTRFYYSPVQLKTFNLDWKTLYQKMYFSGRLKLNFHTEKVLTFSS